METQLYALKQRVNNLYFGVLLIEAQLAQNQLNAETLQSQLEKAQVALKHGTTLPSNVAELKAELLRLAMQRTEYEATKGMYLKMLSTFIGKELPEDTAQRYVVLTFILRTCTLTFGSSDKNSFSTAVSRMFMWSLFALSSHWMNLKL